MECVGGAIEDICHDLNISIDYFENQYDRKVDEVFIAGGASLTLGLDEILEKTVQKKVWKWNPAQYLELKMDEPEKEQLIAHAASSAIAVGLASRIRKD